MKVQSSDKKKKALPTPGNSLADLRAGNLSFVGPFLLSCVGVYALIFFLPDQWLRPINEHTARTLGYVVNLLKFPASVSADQVISGSFAVRIIPECTALLTLGLFGSFVAFYPSPISKKQKSFLFAIPFFYLGNLLRLAIVFVAGLYSRRLFGVLHVYLGQVFTIALILLACLLYVRWVDRSDEGRSVFAQSLSFFGRFALIASCLFFLWMEIHHPYIRFVDWFMIVGFSFFDYRLIIPGNIGYYWETFNVVTFVSLILAADLKPWMRTIKVLAGGLCTLFTFHLIHRTNNALMTAFGFVWIMPLDLILCAIAQYVLPVVMWLWLITFSSGMHVSKPGKRVHAMMRRRVNG